MDDITDDDGMTHLERKESEREEIKRMMDEYEEKGGEIEKIKTKSNQEIINAGREEFMRKNKSNFGAL